MKTRVPTISAAFELSLLTCALLLFSDNALAQANPKNPPRPQFHWDWHAGQELSGKDWLENARIKKAEREAIAAAITEELKSNKEEFDLDTKESLREAVMKTRVKMIDLDGDGVPEVVAQAFAGCSATGNCPFWIFRKTGKHYEPLLETHGQTFTIQKHSTLGYKDIVVSVHGSATQSGLMDYRYSDGQYVAAGCYNAEWEALEGNEVHELKGPRITPYPCSND
jgi:hypothetical protein